MQLVGETPAALGGGLFAAVGGEGQAHDHALGLPLLEQLRDTAEALVAAFGKDDLQRPRLAGQRIADRDADFFFRRNQRPAGFPQAWPASPASITGSIPRSFMAAG